jgi:peptidoglycan/LPS O-acetylase OafA/YrhL
METISRHESAAGSRDRYIDFLRAFSLLVVVLWHWGFTILEVSETSVSPNNPIGSTRWLWVATWVLQVMPVFFFVGGYTHRLAFDDYTPGTSRRFLRRRMRRLLLPSLGLIAVWIAFGLGLEATIDPEWTWSAVILVLSPLWFLAVYVVLVLIAPIAIRAHWRWGELVPVWLLGLAGVLDVLRFTHGQGWAAWVNFLVIWGLAHQLGFFYDRLVAAPRRTGWVFLWSGLFSLVALTNMGFYPRSLVGVPGDRFSNMGPPTLTIVALIFLQIGVVLLVRTHVLDRLQHDDRWKRGASWVTVNSLPLYLFHSSGMAVVVALGYLLFGYRPPGRPNAEWWLTRPLWIVLPFLATLPFLIGYRRSVGVTSTETVEDAAV